jgi:predicted aspartyl protease
MRREANTVRRWVFLVTLGIFFTPMEPARAQYSAPSEGASAVAFDLRSDFLVVVEGQAGNVRDLRFIVDTGATRSVIERKVALRLALKRHPGRIVNFDRSVLIEWAELPAFQMGPLRAESLQVIVADLAEYSEFSGGVDGIIGLDLLSRAQKFTIDYQKKKLYFELPSRAHRPISGCFVAPVVVQGTTLRLGLDTGLAEILLYKNRVKVRTEGKPKRVRMGRIRGTEVAVPEVQLGGREKVITAVLIDAPAELRASGLDGYLGTGSLHATRIEFDFANMILRWQ